MKKIIFTFTCLFWGFTVFAQDITWNISNFATISALSTDHEYLDTNSNATGLFFTRGTANGGSVASQNKTFSDDFQGTKRLQFGGRSYSNSTLQDANPTQRIFSFQINGAAEIKVWYFNSGNSSERTLVIIAGSTVIGTNSATGDSVGHIVSANYTGTEATTIKLAAAGDGLNIFKIEVTYALISNLPTLTSATCANIYDVVPGETIAANPVTGATNYRFKFVDEANEEYFVERENGSMTIHQFAAFIGSGFKYNHTYQGSVEAYVDDEWTGYGASCEFTITDDPRTKLRADFCDLPLSTMDTRLFTNRLPLFNEYTFEVINTSTNAVVTFTRIDPQATGFRLTQEAASILTADTVYEVRVKAKSDDWEIPYGDVCTVTTPSIPGTIKLRSGSCDVTLTSMTNQAVLSEVVPNAIEYEFEVTNTATSAVTTHIKSNWVFPMSDLGAGFTSNNTYSIRVRARIGSTFNSYGTPCTVTTPTTIPAPQLTALYCGQTFENYRSLYANRVVGFEEFTFEVTNDQSEETIEVVRPSNFFHLANHTSAAFLNGGNSFTIKVKVKVGGVYGNYGTPCVVTIGAPGLLNYNLNGTSLVEKIEAYPNPFTNEFTVRLANISLATFQLFDINGRLIESRQVQDEFEITMGQQLNAGVYLVRVEQNGEVQSFKMIKK